MPQKERNHIELSDHSFEHLLTKRILILRGAGEIKKPSTDESTKERKHIGSATSIFDYLPKKREKGHMLE